MPAVVEALTTPQSLKLPPLDRVLNTSRNQPNTNTEPNIPSNAATRCAFEVSRPAVTRVKPVKHKTKTKTVTGATGGRNTFRLDGERDGRFVGRVGDPLSGRGLACRGAGTLFIARSYR